MSAVLPRACSKRMARSAVIGASQAQTAARVDSSICKCAAASAIVRPSASTQSSRMVSPGCCGLSRNTFRPLTRTASPECGPTSIASGPGLRRLASASTLRRFLECLFQTNGQVHIDGPVNLAQHRQVCLVDFNLRGGVGNLEVERFETQQDNRLTEVRRVVRRFCLTAR